MNRKEKKPLSAPQDDKCDGAKKWKYTAAQLGTAPIQRIDQIDIMMASGDEGRRFLTSRSWKLSEASVDYDKNGSLTTTVLKRLV